MRAAIDLAYRLPDRMPIDAVGRLRLHQDRAQLLALPVPVFPARGRAADRGRAGAAGLSCSPTSTSTITTSSFATFRARKAPPPTKPALGSTPATARPRSSCRSRRCAAQFGVRYEDAVADGPADRQRARRRPGSPTITGCPAATVTWNFADDMQLRLHASKTIARPQFRELAPQIYQDFESDREFTGNPFLTDSRADQCRGALRILFPARRAVHASPASTRRSTIRSNPPPSSPAAASCAPASPTRPQATLYGVEAELQTYLPLSGLGKALRRHKRLLLVGNYTYTQSQGEIGRQPGHRPGPPAGGGEPAVRGRRAAHRPVGPSRQPPVRHREYGPPVAGDLPAHLRQRAGHRARPDPGQRAPARHHREARPPARFRRPRGGPLPRPGRRAQARGAQPPRPGL